MTPSPQPKRCDIENQCQHFCVYKQMVCPVYIRSHPYQSERDKVLDRMRDELNEMGCYGDVCCLEHFKKVVAELRAEGR
jgi:hypothetical protein